MKYTCKLQTGEKLNESNSNILISCTNTDLTKKHLSKNYQSETAQKHNINI